MWSPNTQRQGLLVGFHIYTGRLQHQWLLKEFGFTDNKVSGVALIITGQHIWKTTISPQRKRPRCCQSRSTACPLSDPSASPVISQEQIIHDVCLLILSVLLKEDKYLCAKPSALGKPTGSVTNIVSWLETQDYHSWQTWRRSGDWDIIYGFCQHLNLLQKQEQSSIWQAVLQWSLHTYNKHI